MAKNLAGMPYPVLRDLALTKPDDFLAFRNAHPLCQNPEGWGKFLQYLGDEQVKITKTRDEARRQSEIERRVMAKAKAAKAGYDARAKEQDGQLNNFIKALS